MKYTSTKQVNETHEVELPAFVKFGRAHHKILDEKKILSIEDYSFCKRIELVSSDHCNPFCSDGWVFITEDEFNEVFSRVLSELRQFETVKDYGNIERGHSTNPKVMTQ